MAESIRARRRFSCNVNIPGMGGQPPIVSSGAVLFEVEHTARAEADGAMLPLALSAEDGSPILHVNPAMVSELQLPAA